MKVKDIQVGRFYRIKGWSGWYGEVLEIKPGPTISVLMRPTNGYAARYIGYTPADEHLDVLSRQVLHEMSPEDENSAYEETRAEREAMRDRVMAAYGGALPDSLTPYDIGWYVDPMDDFVRNGTSRDLIEALLWAVENLKEE